MVGVWCVNSSHGFQGSAHNGDSTLAARVGVPIFRARLASRGGRGATPAVYTYPAVAAAVVATDENVYFKSLSWTVICLPHPLHLIRALVWPLLISSYPFLLPNIVFLNV